MWKVKCVHMNDVKRALVLITKMGQTPYFVDKEGGIVDLKKLQTRSM